jgi:hypothetical protein
MWRRDIFDNCLLHNRQQNPNYNRLCEPKFLIQNSSYLNSFLVMICHHEKTIIDALNLL